MRRRLAYILVSGVWFAVATSGHDVITTPLTFSREISRLVYARCASCHRPGGRAFSLMTYADARPWAAAIKEEVLERRMPPWGAVKGFGEFKDDQGLTQEQIELIADWVEGGAPEGDP
ncbi:MAG TPA: cytochrome c, partial [Verrucomicrobiae bacterium]|nr:cytochrome c [Verrucomicrobiae bacterium]